jgi:hypothetical protein
MSLARTFLSGWGLVITLAVGAFASYSPQSGAVMPSMENRVIDRNHRVDKIEARPDVARSYRSKEDIQQDISDLEAERAELLGRYTPQHPSIRDIDRELLILRGRLKMQK